MNAKVYTKDGKEKGEIALPEEVFGCEVNEHLMHEVVILYQANQRQGTSKTKGRAEVSGGGRKPFKQKGTGRARQGSNTSIINVRGGKAFGPQPRSYYTTIPQKMRKAALCSALSARAQENKIIVIDGVAFDRPKTKEMIAVLKAVKADTTKNLLIVGENNANAYMSGRNVKNLCIKNAAEINTCDVLRAENVIFGAETLVEKMKEVVAL
jgi:large subunit ribosomal protein L4